MIIIGKVRYTRFHVVNSRDIKAIFQPDSGNSRIRYFFFFFSGFDVATSANNTIYIYNRWKETEAAREHRVHNRVNEIVIRW